eukprot:8064771-Ditylum_brightwellii.AAC.1
MGKNPTAHKSAAAADAAHWQAVRTAESVPLAEGDLVCLALPAQREALGLAAATFRVVADPAR